VLTARFLEQLNSDRTVDEARKHWGLQNGQSQCTSTAPTYWPTTAVANRVNL
jgi:hypothetical protein